MTPRIRFLTALCAASLAGGGCGAASTRVTASETPSTWIRTDAATYATDGDSVRISITNIGEEAFNGGPCGAILEMWTGTGWKDSPQQPVAGHACPDPAVILGPGTTYANTVLLGHIDVGLYRFRLDALYRQVDPQLSIDERVTNAFRVE